MSVKNNKLMKIRLQPCLFKTKCRHCCSSPMFLFFSLNKTVDLRFFVKKNIFENPALFFELRKNYNFDLALNNRTLDSSMLFDDMTMSMLKTSASNIYYDQNKDKLVFLLECYCGKTVWSFMQSEREHIKNRKLAQFSFVKPAFLNSNGSFKK